jgi:hypothetical protein
MHTSLIFKEQAKVYEQGLKEKVSVKPHNSKQYIEGYDLLCYKDNSQELHSSIVEIKEKVYCPGTMII